MVSEKTLLKRALDEMNLTWGEDVEMSLEQLDQYISEGTEWIQEAEDKIEELKIDIASGKEGLTTLQILRRQVDIEEYKELNKNKNIKIL